MKEDSKLAFTEGLILLRLVLLVTLLELRLKLEADLLLVEKDLREEGEIIGSSLLL